MKTMKNLAGIFLVLTLSTITVNGQKFYEDGSMILKKVSTNKKYGYEPNHKTSIKVGKIENQFAYLSALRGPNGEEVRFWRVSSCCHFKTKSAIFGYGLLDKYEVYYKGLKEPIILYINGYEYKTPKAPVGFTFVTADKVVKPTIFPADSILKVNFCNNKELYAVAKEFLLKEKIGEKPEPDTNPYFDGGIEELIQFFAKNELTDQRAKDLMFSVVIAFVVDCNGKAGNFAIISKGKGLGETLANQVLEKVNKMPQNWKPATKNGKTVDSYQVLYFSIDDGKFAKVSYR